MGVLRSKIFAAKTKTGLHYFFYIFSILVFLISLIFLFFFWSDFSQPNIFGIIAFVIAIGSSITLFVFTKKYLQIQDVFHTSELDPIVNKFTCIADKEEIKLFAGDLNFFGHTPAEMDTHPQYTTLRSLQFAKISILCEKPNDNSKKIRYGKMICDMPQTDLRFYKPPKEADLKVRGRMIKVNGVDKLLMYVKTGPKYYQAIETDTSNTSGALYNNIWNLVWSMADEPNSEQIQEFKNLFLGK